jgi:phosphoribosyl-ATP pyrophosphohydrolase/phosphoribosyl-AMP cyclohydrolase
MHNDTLGFLDELDQVVRQRITEKTVGSYTADLAARGIKRVAQKTGEEAVELAIASVAGDNSEVKEEAADLLYHLIVLLALRNVSLADVVAVLRGRQKN